MRTRRARKHSERLLLVFLSPHRNEHTLRLVEALRVDHLVHYVYTRYSSTGSLLPVTRYLVLVCALLLIRAKATSGSMAAS